MLWQHFKDNFIFIKTRLCYTRREINFQPLPRNWIFRVCDQFKKKWVSLTPAKKQKILSLCFKLLATEQVQNRFIAVPCGKLYYGSLERCKTKFLVFSKGNFDKIMHVSKEATQDILWWKHNIIGAYTPIVRENPSVIISTDTSSFGWGASLGKTKTGGQFSTEDN